MFENQIGLDVALERLFGGKGVSVMSARKNPLLVNQQRAYLKFDDKLSHDSVLSKTKLRSNWSTRLCPLYACLVAKNEAVNSLERR